MNIREFAALENGTLIYSDKTEQVGVVVMTVAEGGKDCILMTNPWKPDDDSNHRIKVLKSQCQLYTKFTTIEAVESQKVVNKIMYNELMEVKTKLIFLGSQLTRL